MALPMMKSFICGLSVKTGSLIIGWLSLINGIFQLVPVILSAIAYSNMSAEDENNLIDWIANKTENNVYGNETVPSNIHNQDKELVEELLGPTYAFIILAGLINVSAATMLLVGICKKNKWMMLPWLVLCGKTCVILFIVGTVWFLSMPFQRLSNASFFDDLLAKATITMLMMIITAIPVYAFLIVFTSYRHAKYEKEQLNNSFQKL